MTLSAHNTIFLLLRRQHIVLFRKQIFHPILFVIVRGSGCAHVHLGKHTRHARGNGAEERKPIRNPDTPKEMSVQVAVSFILFCYSCCLAGIPKWRLWTNCIRISWDICKKIKIPRTSLTRPESLKDGPGSWHFSRIVACCGQWRWCTLNLGMSPPVSSSPGQRPQHANRFSKILNQESHRSQPPHFLTMKVKSRKENQLAKGHTALSVGARSRLATMPTIYNLMYNLKALCQLLSHAFPIASDESCMAVIIIFVSQTQVWRLKGGSGWVGCRLQALYSAKYMSVRLHVWVTWSVQAERSKHVGQSRSQLLA